MDAVLKVLYEKPKYASKKVAADDTDSESYDGDEVGEFQIDSEEDELKLTDNLHPLIQKVRNIVNMFRK